MPTTHPTTPDRRLRHDAAYRKVFGHRRTVTDFVRQFLPGLARDYDLSTLRRMPESFVTSALEQRHVDMVWRMDAGGGRWPHVFLILEFQSSVARDMPMRALDYSVRVWRSLDREGRGPGGEYPSVIPAVLYTGERRWSAATGTRELFGDKPEDELRHVPRHEFLLLALRLMDPRNLLPDNVMAWIVRLEQARSRSEIVELAGRLVALLEKAGETKLIGSVVPWITKVLAARVGADGRAVDFTIPRTGEDRMSATLAERSRKWGDELNRQWLEKGIRQGVERGIRQGVERGIRQGVEQGRTEGRTEGARELVRRLAARRFGPEAAERLGRALNELSDPDRTEAAAAMVFECGSVDELMAELAGRSH